MDIKYAAITSNLIGICLMIAATYIINRKYPLGNETFSGIPIKYIKIGGYFAIGYLAISILMTLFK